MRQRGARMDLVEPGSAERGPHAFTAQTRQKLAPDPLLKAFSSDTLTPSLAGEPSRRPV
jgi:hypothetical protein